MAKTNGNEMVKAVGQENFMQQSFSTDELFEEGFTAEFTASLKVGDKIQGLYMGPGADIEQINEATGEVREPLKTWRVRAVNKTKDGYELQPATAHLVGSYDLNKFFAGLTPGNTLVAIEHLGQQPIGQKRVNRYKKLSRVDTTRQASGPALSDKAADAKINAQAQA